jgi:hypothetical protein
MFVCKLGTFYPIGSPPFSLLFDWIKSFSKNAVVACCLMYCIEEERV